jgi:nicotinamidase-related amidase
MTRITKGAPMKPSFLLSKKDTVLLVIDVQDKFTPVIPHFNDLVDNITRLILTFQMYKMPIIVTEQYPQGLGTTVERLRKLFPLLEVVDKTELSATDNPRFWSQVNPLQPKTFVVCGIETHVCINQTVIKLLEKEMEVHVVADATGSRHPLDYNVALRKMELAGAHIATTEMCLFELAEKAGTETFKNIQRMVKNKPSQPVAAAPAKALRAKKPEKDIRPSIPATPQSGKPPAATKEQEEEKTRPGTDTTVVTEAAEQKVQPVDTSASASAPAQQENTAAENDAESTASMQEVLASIEKEPEGAVKDTDKTEKEIMNDMKEIDKLIKNIDEKEIEKK